MTKEEFRVICNIKEAVSDADYEIVETVYMWHPLIDSKDDFGRLWERGGPLLIEDMLPRALQVKELEERLSAANIEAARLKTEIGKLRATARLGLKQ